MPALTESAIVVLVPEAEHVVDRWRMDLDPSAERGVPAHITLLYPFAAPADLDDSVIATVARTIEAFRPVDYQLDEVRWFDETVVWFVAESG